VFSVDRSDENVFEALACDSFALKNDRSSNPSDEDRLSADVWTQVKPADSQLAAMAGKSKEKKSPNWSRPNFIQFFVAQEWEAYFEPRRLPAQKHTEQTTSEFNV
jgi:hypothetical protein